MLPLLALLAAGLRASGATRRNRLGGRARRRRQRPRRRHAAGRLRRRPRARRRLPVAGRHPRREQPADVPADARGVRGDDGQARHLRRHARRRLRRARRHLRRAAVVDPELLRPLERRADERRLDQVDGGESPDGDRRAGVPRRRFTARPQPQWLATASDVVGRDRQAGRQDHRRAHRGGNRRQGSAQHQARRVRALVDSDLLGRPARSADRRRSSRPTS